MEMTVEDRETIRQALLAWRERGVADPVIPVGVDLNGDGVADGFALDGDQVEVRSGVPIGDTVYVADGEDLAETGV